MLEKLKIQRKDAFSLLSLILIGVFAFQVANKSLYTHSHILAFGQVVTHAHPFDKSEGEGDPKSHRHTQAEMIILNQVNILFVCIIVIFLIGLTYSKLKLNSILVADYRPVYLCHRKGRSPPSL